MWQNDHNQLEADIQQSPLAIEPIVVVGPVSHEISRPAGCLLHQPGGCSSHVMQTRSRGQHPSSLVHDRKAVPCAWLSIAAAACNDLANHTPVHLLHLCGWFLTSWPRTWTSCLSVQCLIALAMSTARTLSNLQSGPDWIIHISIRIAAGVSSKVLSVLSPQIA